MFFPRGVGRDFFWGFEISKLTIFMGFEKMMLFLWVLWCFALPVFWGHLKNNYIYRVVNGVVESSGYFSRTCAVVLGQNIGSH